jgi:type I restriction enzyme S subunit
MEVKPGHKQTEGGVIPMEWDAKPLSRLAQIQGGIAKNSNVDPVDPISVHYLRVANVQDGFLDLSKMSKIYISRHDLLRYSVLPGDVLMNEGGDLDKLGRGAIWHGEFYPCVHQNHVFVVRCKAALLPEYLNVWTATSRARRFFLLAGKQTTNLASISKSSLGELPVALPPLPEQHAIAAALGDVDGLLGGLDRLIAKKRDLKQAAMQQLLTGQTRLPGFSGEWEVKRLGELFAFSGGFSASRDQLSTDGHCYLHYGDIHGATKTSIDTDVDFQNIPKLNISLKRVSCASLLDDGDVVFVDASEDDAGTSKHIVVFNRKKKPFISGLHTIVAKEKTNEISHSFRKYCFKSAEIQAQFIFYAVGIKVSGVSKSNITKIFLSFPSLPEQIAIAEVLSAMDAELAALEQRREKTRALKQAMMQELLTGRTRLAGPENKGAVAC